MGTTKTSRARLESGGGGGGCAGTMKIPLARLESGEGGEACMGATKALGLVWRAEVVARGVRELRGPSRSFGKRRVG